MKILKLLMPLFFCIVFSSCLAGIEPSPVPPPPPSAVQAPTLDDISVVLKAAGSGYCMNPGEGWSVILPDCTWTEVDESDRKYTLEGLPAWLAFDGSTREVSLSGVDFVPKYDTAFETTYTCSSASDPQVSDSITFTINDCDTGGIIDYLETLHSEPPRIVNVIGYVLLNDFNVDVYMPPYLAGENRKIPWALSERNGLDPKDKDDDNEDFDGDGLTNLLEITNDTNLFIRPSDPSFNLISTQNSSSVNYGIAYGDFNNDGFNDMAVGLANGGIGIHLNNTSGGFYPEAINIFTGVTNRIVDIAVADFNNDRKMDVAAVVNIDFDLFIAYGDGADKLILNQLEPLSGAKALTVGDFNGDGNPDIALIDEDNVRIYICTLAAGACNSLYTYDAGGDPKDVATADINGDNILDLIISDDNLNQIRVYLGNGDGTFVLSAQNNIDNNPQNITLADFDNDSFIDVMVSEDVNSIALLTGNGDGTFNPVWHIPVSSSMGFITAADFNGDNAIDLAMADSVNDFVIIGINTLKNTGAVTFTETSYSTSAKCFSIAVFDINNDNMLDVTATDMGALASVVRLYIQ